MVGDALPASPEQWAFATAALAALGGGMGAVFSWLTGRDKRRVDALAASQQARIEAAERRESEANQRAKEERDIQHKRLDAAIEGISGLTRITTEMTAVVRQINEGHRISHEEVRRANGGIEAILRELQRPISRR